MTDPKTILIDARRLRATTGRYTRELLNGLEKTDRTNNYLVVANKEDEPHWQPSSPNFKLVTVKWDHYTFGEQLGFAWFLYKQKADLVHFTMPQQPVLYLRRKVTTIHDLTLVKFANDSRNPIGYKIKQAIFKICLKIFIKTSKYVITIAKFTQGEIANYGKVSLDRVVVTHPAGNAMSKKSRKFAPAEGKDFIMYVGNMFPYKNIGRLIEAHQLLLKDFPQLHLILVGKLEEDGKILESNARSKGYKNINFTGFVDDEQLAWLYKNARAYVFPSLSEGFGLPGIEGMQFDLPVVSSKASVLPEVHGKAAHYFDPLSEADMARAIKDVLTNKVLRNKLIKEGRVVRSLYSWEDMAKKTYQTYLAALKD